MYIAMNEVNIPCDIDGCGKQAVVNFQSGIAQYDIVKGEYEWNGFEADNSTNEHFCEEHRTDK